MKNKENETILDKFSKISFASAIVGVCTIGICPAFGVIGIVAPLIMKIKKADISDETKSRNKKAVIAGVASFVMFAVDLGLAIFANSKLGWF